MAYDPFASVQRGIDFTQGIFDRSANMRSGQAASRGDYAAAANAQFTNGNLAAGTALQDRGTALDTAARARRTAEGAAALGVYKQVTDALEGELPNGPEAVTAAFARIRPVLEQTGATAEQLNAYEGMLRQDPEGAIRTVRGAIGQAEWEFRDGGAGDVVAVRQGPGGTIQSELAYNAPDRPTYIPGVGFLLPPGGAPAGSSAPTRNAVPGAPAAVPAMTGPAISGGPLWSRQEQQESGGRQSAVSPVGAFGVAQLMPETAAEMARQMGVSPEALRTDANLNRRAGQMYMDQQLEKYGGNEVLALAAYNAGPGRVDEWIQRFGDPRTGEITTEEFAAAIPFNETRNYVRNITGGNYSGSQAQTAQGSDQGPELQDLGGGYTLQPMTTAADERAARAEARANRSDDREEARFQREQSGALTPAQQASQSAQTFTQERQLRTEFGNHPAVRTLATVRPQVQIIGNIARRASAGEPISAADDLALIFSYMKMLDPGSVVREGEFANAQNTAGIPERILNAYNRARDGTRLSDNQRNEFFRSATGVMQGYQDSYNEVVTRQRGLAESYGLNADRIAPQTPARTQQQTPRLRFTPTQAQTQASQGIVAARGNAQARRGERLNPILINPADPRTSFGNVPSGSYFITPDGQLRGPKP